MLYIIYIKSMNKPIDINIYKSTEILIELTE